MWFNNEFNVYNNIGEFITLQKPYISILNIKKVNGIGILFWNKIWNLINEKTEFFFVSNNEKLISKWREIADNGSDVIVGRCADYILEDRDNVVTFFITVPIEELIKRATAFYKFDPTKALKAIKKVYKKRKDYYNFYTNRKWGVASNYDLTLNSRIGVEKKWIW